ncbi:MAG: FCD domain-containing protein, partial [Pseudomonas caspiana]
EPSAVRLIIEQGRKTAPAILRAAIEQEREVMTDPTEFSRAIARFHRLIIELSANRPLIHLWDAMQQVIEQHQAMVVSVYRRGQSTEEIVGSVLPGLRSQEKLVKLIETGDEDLAETHWRKHMQAAYKTWMTGYEDVKISTMMQE